PLAKPSTSVEPPTSSPATDAFHPSFWLCPSTSQNGVPLRAPVTRSSSFVLPFAVTVTRGCAPALLAACVTELGSSPRGPSTMLEPFASEPHTSPSTSIPERSPGVDRTTWSPRSSTTPLVAGAAHGTRSSGRPATASAGEPWSDIGNDPPSIVSRSVRQVDGTSVGTGARCTPATPTSAIATGSTLGSRTPVTVIRTSEPVNGANVTGIDTGVAPTTPSVTAG